MNKPDYWQLLKITHNDQMIYKVFATWVGGYLSGDSWRFNSGIVKVVEEDDFYDLIGASGSVYRCGNDKHFYRNSSYTQGVLDNLISRAKEVGGSIELVPFDKVEGVLSLIGE